MPRRRVVSKRPILPDPRHGEQLVTKFTNSLMRHGKKATAERIIYRALDLVHERTREDPVQIFHAAVENVEPFVEVKSRRVGGSNYQVPVEVRKGRSTTLALRWLVSYARQRRERTMTERLMNEILDASNGLGAAVKKREDTHKMAEANKAFAHYRW